MSHASVALVLDRAEISLAATMHRLHLESVISYWTVPTPPVAWPSSGGSLNSDANDGFGGEQNALIWLGDEG